MSTQKTLITALDKDNDDAYAFMVTHTTDVDAWPAVVKAFKEYAKTAEGKKYIKNNGSNCGEALFTPKQYLIKHGILSVETVTGDHHVIVNHDDSLLA